MSGIRGWPNPHSPRPGNRLRCRQRFRRFAEDRQLDNPQRCGVGPVGHRQPNKPAFGGRDFLENRIAGGGVRSLVQRRCERIVACLSVPAAVPQSQLRRHSVGNWTSHPEFLPRPREGGLAMPNAATQSTPPVGAGSRAKIPWIGLFLIFLAFRASVRNGCARLWVSGQRMRRAPRKRSVSCQIHRLAEDLTPRISGLPR